MTKASAAELLDLLIDRAPKLRKAGYRKVSLENAISFELEPLEPEAPPAAANAGDDQAEPSDPFHDPDTFGRTRVPGNQKRER